MTPREPTHEEIAALAYLYWEESGQAEGHDLENWLKAEETLKGEQVEKPKPAQHYDMSRLNVELD